MTTPKLCALFFKTSTGKEPVREWLKSLSIEDRKAIGTDVADVQYAWPIGMPLVRKLAKDLWEVRSDLNNGIARVIFTVNDDTMILLHGFIKKSQKTPTPDLDLAKDRLKSLRKYL